MTFAEQIARRLDAWTGEPDDGVRDIVVYSTRLHAAWRGDLVVLHRLLGAFAEVAGRRGGHAAIKRFAAKAPFGDARVELPWRMGYDEIALLTRLDRREDQTARR